MVTNVNATKNGRWILVEGNLKEDKRVVYKCSQCGSLTIWEKAQWSKSIYPGEFCHHCFANMVNGRTVVLD